MRLMVLEFGLCAECANCTAVCSYPYHPSNRGVESLRERIALELVCRKCERHLCEKACVKQALEFTGSGLRRNIQRCVSCGNCALACPFGALYQSYLVYQSDICDQCREREPMCAQTCPKGAIRFVEDAPAEAREICKGVLATGAGWSSEDRS